MSATAKVTQYYLNSTGLGEKAFAEEIKAALPRTYQIAATTVARWASGQVAPSQAMLEKLLMGVSVADPDWRIEFALHCLAVKDPADWDLYEGRIWKLFRLMRIYVVRDYAGIRARLAEALEVEHV